MAEPGGVVEVVVETPSASSDVPILGQADGNRKGRSTMAAAYESSRKSVREAYSSNNTGSDILRLNTMRETESRGENLPVAAALTQHLSIIPSSIPQQIKLNLSTAQLLQLKGEEIPNTDQDFSLALKKTGERLELIVNPVPDAQSLGSASVFHMLGREGSKQPSILYGTLGYVIDYLIAPHVGMQKLNLVSLIPVQLRRPSMNVATRAESGKNIVKEAIADWVLRLWDAFLLTFKDGCTTEDLVNELVSRFRKSVERRPGASERPISMSISNYTFVQTSFETNNGHLVVARRVLDEEGLISEASITSRSGRAILAWMGLVEENRSAAAIKTNTLLLTLHWIRSSTGAIDLASSRPAFSSLYDCLTSASNNEEGELASLARLVLKDLRVIEDICKFDLTKVHRSFGLDFEGVLTHQTADTDQFCIREMCLCYSSRHLPNWCFRGEPLFKRNPESVAAELTLIMYDYIYRHIHPCMLVDDKARHSASPVQDMIRIFRVLSYWPLTWLFEEGIKMNERLHRLVFFLSLAEQFRKLCNFHALFGLMGGLTQPTAAWLWQSLHHADKAHKKFDDLKRAISSYGDYRVYKADLSHCFGKSRIPFMGVTTRHLTGLEHEHPHSMSHPHLYHFARQVARSAAINEFLGGQRHPYAAKTGYAYALCAGPPGASAFQLHPEGVLVGSRYAQNPPSTVWNGTYSQAKLSANDVDVHFGVAPQVLTPPSFVGSVELPHDEELCLLLAHSLSETLTEDGVKDLSAIAKASQDEVVVHSLEAAGFM
jgi:hypothetical protein